jgi:hypothetical protein
MNWQDEQVALLKKGFVVRDCEFGGDECVLIYPSKSAMFDINWTKDLLKYRSSIWVKAHKVPISISYPKFFNWGENDTLSPPPESLMKSTIVDKIDGSTLIVSKWCSELIVRTRGTTDARGLENGHEIEQLMEKYEFAFDNEYINRETHSMIFEWVTPTNRIVLDYGEEPLLYLTGILRHEDYNMADQNVLDGTADMFGFERPETYEFDSISELISVTKEVQDREGVCVYYNKGQSILKLKGEEYLAKHAFKSHCTINSVIDMFINRGRPTYNEFYEQIQNEFDWECVEMAKGLISNVCDASSEVTKMVEHMELFVEPLRRIDRKTAALKITEAYGKTSRAGFVFSILDKKPLNTIAYRKLLHQLCKEGK